MAQGKSTRADGRGHWPKGKSRMAQGKSSALADPPRVDGYRRVSTDAQAASGLGLAAQLAALEARCTVIADQAGARVGEVLSDEGVSATRNTLVRRPEGRRLDQRLRAGDHVVFRLDRAFRGHADCVATCDRWIRRGVTIHLLDMEIDTSTPAGQLVLWMLAAVAEYEPAVSRQRVRDALQVRRTRGESTNGKRRLGWRLFRRRRSAAELKKMSPNASRWKYRERPHEAERKLGRRVDRLRRNGHACSAIAERFTRERVRHVSGGAWTAKRVWLLHQAYLAGWP